jgi:hypothetical protein
LHRQYLKFYCSPERLGVAFLVHSKSYTFISPQTTHYINYIEAPWFFWTTFKLISPFIDPVTRAKVLRNFFQGWFDMHVSNLAIFTDSIRGPERAKGWSENRQGFGMGAADRFCRQGAA